MTPTRWLGIRGRLGAAFVLLSTVPALLLGLYHLDLYLGALETLALEHLDSRLALLQGRLDGFLSLAERDLHAVGNGFAFQEFARARHRTPALRVAVERALTDHLRGSPACYRLRLLDERGDEVIKARRRADGECEVAPHDELEVGVGAYALDRLEASSPDQLLLFPSEIRSEPHGREVVQVITLVRPVTARAGGWRGLVVLEILAQAYFRILEAGDLPPYGTVAVADLEGHYLYHSGYRGDWNLLLASRSSAHVRRHYAEPAASQILSGRSGRASGASGQVISFVPLRVGSEVPYVLFHAVPSEALFSSMHRFRRLLAALLSLTALLAGLLAVLAAKRFTDPIRALGASVAVLARGDFSHRIRLRTGDEVEDLAAGFNGLAEALQERESRLTALRDYQEDIVKSLNDGILVLDRGLTVRVLNPALARMAGIDGKDAVGRPLGEVLPPAQAQALHDALRAALGGDVAESEGMLSAGPGGLATAELCLPMRNACGEITGAILRVTDITARRAAEHALVEAKSTLQTIFDGIKAGIRLVSAQHRVLAANEYHEKLLGRAAQEVVGEPCYAAFGGPHGICASCPGRQALQTGRPAAHELEHPLADGTTVALRVEAYPVSSNGGPPWGFVEYIQDISEKRRLEQELELHASALERTVAERTVALRVSEGRYRDLVENSPEMIHLLSPEGRFLHANKTEREKLGLSLEKLAALSLADLVPRGERRRLARHQREVAARGHGRLETVFLNARGEPIDVEIDATAQLDESGRLVQTRAFVRDVTERKRLEEKLSQTEKMVAVGQLASGLAHEIGTPLNAISGTAEYLIMSGQTGQGREELESIRAQARRISHLVRRMLDFSRPSRLRRVVLDPREALRGTLHLLEPPLSAEGVTVDLALDAAPMRLRADPHQLQQVFTNVILNAQQAMPHGGLLKIATRRITEPKRGQVEFSFEDAGEGIGEENLKRIFDPFFTTKEVGKGTGLGLAICYAIVQKHGGTIRAENVPGRGARMLVTLPLLEG